MTGAETPNAGIPGVILAGGGATRMGGGDKGLRALAGVTLLERVVGRLRPQVAALALNANGDPDRFAAFGLPVIADAAPDMGPLAGVLAGMRWAAGRPDPSTHIVTAAADTPFLPADLVARLCAAAPDGETPVLARSAGRVHPVFGLWPVALADDLAAFLEKSAARRVSAYAGDRRATAHADFALVAGRDPFFNVNTPEDLVAAAAMLSREAS